MLQSTQQVAQYYEVYIAELQLDRNVNDIRHGLAATFSLSEGFTPSPFTPGNKFFEDGGPFDPRLVYAPLLLCLRKPLTDKL